MKSKHYIINIGRQVGSGGLVIAKKLSEILPCEMYDKRILNLAAKESGFCERFFEQNDEKRGFFHSFCFDYLPLFNDVNVPGSQFSQENLFRFQSEAIQNAAKNGNCIFVGRCADYVLREFDNTLNVFFTAPMEERVKRVANDKHLNEEDAESYIEDMESKRASYYNYYTGKKWGHAASYDLCIDTSLLGIDGTTRLLIDLVEKRFGE